MKSKSRSARMDEKFLTDLFKVGAVRLEKRLSRCSPREMTMPKITNLVTRCPSYNNILNELTNLPEKDNVK